ncbi:hypothetical protein [Caballeronia sp. 15715]|uniref:hypothetical protein n=1 Tax=unclassified Caballeronia TaxID=2646786 RepID=UPI0039E70E44
MGSAQGKATCAKCAGHERMRSMRADVVQQREVCFAAVAQCGLLQASVPTNVQKQADEGLVSAAKMVGGAVDIALFSVYVG